MAQPGTSSPAGAGDPGLRCAPPGLQVDHARSRARPVGDLPGPRPAHAKAELDRLLLAGLELHVPSEDAAFVLEVTARRLRAAQELDLDGVVLRHRNLVDDAHLDRPLVQVLHDEAIVAHVGLRGPEHSPLTMLVADDGMA